MRSRGSAAGCGIFCSDCEQRRAGFGDAPRPRGELGFANHPDRPRPAGASGDAFVRALREFSPSVPVLVISGMDEAEQEYAGLEVTFLHKPCAPEDLIAQVRNALETNG